MNTFSKVLNKFSGLLKLLGAAALTGLVLLTVVDVIGRYFKHPILGSMDLAEFLAVIVMAAALPYTYKLEGHVGVEILVRLFSTKTQLIMDLCTRIMTLVLFSLVTWQMVLYAMHMYKTGEVSMTIEFPIHIIIYVLAAGLFVFCITILESILNTLTQLKELKTK